MAAQIETRLRRLAFELRHARRAMQEETVHELRVALRRLIESIHVCKGLVDEDEAQATLRELRKIMRAAGRVRAFDIAAGQLTRAEVPADAPIFARLKLERMLAAADLYRRLQRAYRQNATVKWRAQLKVIGSTP